MSTTTTNLLQAIPASRRKLLAATLGLVAFLYWASLYMYVPTLPVYVQGKVSSLAIVGTVLSMYGLWQLFSRLPTGIMADWAGVRKPFIMVGLLIVGSGALIMSQSQDASGLILGRALTGLGAGTWVPLLVLFTMLFPPEETVRATGILTLLNTLGRMLATGSTGVLNHLGGYPLAFELAAAAAGIAFLVIAFYPEKRLSSRPPTIRGLASVFLRREVLVPSLLSVLLHYADWTTTFSFIPILARQYGANDYFLSGLTSGNLLVVFLGNLVISTWGHRLPLRRLVMVGFGLVGIGLIGAATANSLVVLVVAQLAIGLAYGITYPTLMGASIRYVNENERNSAMGLHQSVYAGGMFAGPWLSGILASYIGIQPMFGITTAVLLILSILGIRSLRRE